MKKRTRPFKVVFKDHAGRISVSSFETREARELALARQAAKARASWFRRRSKEEVMTKADAYRRQAEAARKAIDSSPRWIRETAVPPKPQPSLRTQSAPPPQPQPRSQEP